MRLISSLVNTTIKTGEKCLWCKNKDCQYINHDLEIVCCKCIDCNIKLQFCNQCNT